jgi:hypothetical protein
MSERAATFKAAQFKTVSLLGGSNKGKITTIPLDVGYGSSKVAEPS